MNTRPAAYGPFAASELLDHDETRDSDTTMKPTRLKLCEHLRQVAEDTANPERAEAMKMAADEIEELILIERRHEQTISTLKAALMRSA